MLSVDSKGHGSVAARLFARYYRNGEALVEGASSHWRSFSRQFEVMVGEGGEIQKLVGYGFGESHRFSIGSRTFAAIGNWLHLLVLDAPGLRAKVPQAKRVVHQMGLHFSQDAFRQMCADWFLGGAIENGAAGGGGVRTILVIGDGHGILSALLHNRFPSARILLVDLGATLLFQAAHLAKAFPSATHVLTDEDFAATSDATFSYCPADRIESLPKGVIDLAINVASMQEMTPAAVADYFKLLRERRTKMFYCCNRLEKRLPGGEVLRFMDYPWSPDDMHLIDGPCPWLQWIFGRSRATHVRVSGVPIPLVHRYDGVIWHRLTRIAQGF